ncbi:hypothetical protein QNJ25_00395 [Macrococcus caseolyticus]|uniref:hypothetical protein n=1 Tax=Macrococcoides caseolyticum TaxID=69966 RepID=UPI0024BCEC85|nr:hypothetical protein [Macrococcus caseolyticus]MDJ1152401.1 hypothetical protein [Macrococcus caseolyticus]
MRNLGTPMLKRELEKLGYEFKRWSDTPTYVVLKHDEIITEYDHKREQYGISEDERVNALMEEYKQYRQRCGIDKIKEYHGLNETEKENDE